MSVKLLIVDDEEQLRESLARLFKRERYEVLTAASGQEALDIIRAEDPDIVLTDLIMPQMDGISLMRAARAMSFDCEFVLMTAYGTVETAVEAMKEGAYDFITKPYKKAQILRTIERAAEKHALVVENRRLREELAILNEGRTSTIIGDSPPIRKCMEMLRQAAPSSATVLLLGESGTGKELFARELHRQSPRASKPFVAVNCAALPETILEAELFGHVPGAFTGANKLRKGRFEAADGGTLFLDEIGDMSPSLQAKLLRAIDNGSFERLGSSETVKVDVRIIAATNKDLKRMVDEGKFREDLYYRLNVVVIKLPPLRERMDDIPLLTSAFVQMYARKHGKNIKGISDSALALLQSYSWPGNVRELEKAIERAVVLSREEVLTEEDFTGIASAQGDLEPSQYIRIKFGTPLEDVEKTIIRETLKRTGGDKRLAAQILKISERTIYRKMDEDKSSNSQ